MNDIHDPHAATGRSARVIDRLLPPYTRRRFIMQSLKGAALQPGRLHHRLNRRNYELFAFFRAWPFRCNVCGTTGTPIYDMPDLAIREQHGIGVLRESLFCRKCFSTNRHRALVAALLDVLGQGEWLTAEEWRDASTPALRVLDTDNFSPLSRVMSAVPSYMRSVYLPGAPNGAELVPGRVFNADLESLPFEDSSFDLILTSDVMEHVRDCKTAHREIARCLKPGGLYIFTVPFDQTRPMNRTLIDTSTDLDIPLEPLHHHGDPIRGGIKAYRIFGLELFDQLKALGLRAEFKVINRPDHGILAGDVFVARKA